MERFEKPKSLTESVLEHLRNEIVSGKLELGAALSERQLAEQLSVSKTPVREALAQLRTEGLVMVEPRKGAYVFSLSAREVIEICDFRIAIESAAVKLAIERNPDAYIADIGRIVGEMDRKISANEIPAYLALDTEFHAAAFRHCENSYLRDSYERYAGKIAALRTHLAAKPMHTKLSFEEHVALLAALRNRQFEDVDKTLLRHIGRTRHSYAATVDDIAVADAPPLRGNEPAPFVVRSAPKRPSS
ncbi:GntR family transcriptional regulator [Tropicimonas marinistellae]|uniref:GntR family transcriptional regulator n=1 Tax=Tropicimonas marinistellae TaxID=1739787 RepID=UPI00098FB20F|nr:GntR family transcriptional regulator [Tropicimonas marinistellae]